MRPPRGSGRPLSASAIAFAAVLRPSQASNARTKRVWSLLAMQKHGKAVGKVLKKDSDGAWLLLL
jgi:hypothetical protein